METGELLWRRAGTAGPNGIFSPAGKYYVCGDSNVWTLLDLESGDVRCVITLDADNQRLPHEGAFFSSQGDALYFGSIDGPQLWVERRD